MSADVYALATPSRRPGHTWSPADPLPCRSCQGPSSKLSCGWEGRQQRRCAERGVLSESGGQGWCRSPSRKPGGDSVDERPSWRRPKTGPSLHRPLATVLEEPVAEHPVRTVLLDVADVGRRVQATLIAPPTGWFTATRSKEEPLHSDHIACPLAPESRSVRYPTDAQRSRTRPDTRGQLWTVWPAPTQSQRIRGAGLSAPHTREVTGSSPVRSTSVSAGHGPTREAGRTEVATGALV